jgi:hypothetical protein
MRLHDTIAGNPDIWRCMLASKRDLRRRGQIDSEVMEMAPYVVRQLSDETRQAFADEMCNTCCQVEDLNAVVTVHLHVLAQELPWGLRRATRSLDKELRNLGTLLNRWLEMLTSSG